MNMKLTHCYRFILGCLPILLCVLPSTVQAQFDYTTTNDSITITKYTGPGGAITIPSKIAGLPVTSIGDSAFFECISMTSISIPNSVTNIGRDAFGGCNLTYVMIPDSVTNIGRFAFEFCLRLTSVTIGKGVTNVGKGAFQRCSRLTKIYFKGNAPSIDEDSFAVNQSATIYYLSGTTGWDVTFAGHPTKLWKP
jgi:hypothetical protein